MVSIQSLEGYREQIDQIIALMGDDERFSAIQRRAANLRIACGSIAASLGETLAMLDDCEKALARFCDGSAASQPD